MLTENQKYDSIEEFNIFACPDQDQKSSKKPKLGCDLIFSAQDTK